ncbi:MAG: hypothetical protein PWQ72_2021 [Pseudothermotoga sp.]|nr:hypothetical protein [Pseudothermotoga sp.]
MLFIRYKSDNVDVRIIKYQDCVKRSYRMKVLKEVLQSRVIVTTHGPIIKFRNSINIELWHGFPLKAMCLLENGLSLKEKRISRAKYELVDYFISYSNLFNVLINACVGIEGEKYVITGAPRNDFLFKANGIENLKKIFPNLPTGKIIFYLPTFRKGYLDRAEGSFEPLSIFNKFDLKRFIDFLETNQLILVVKLHPFEEAILQSTDVKFSERVLLLRNKDLEKNDLDLYELLNCADLLITDYSSVYFDFLLLNRPILFFAPDLEEYEKRRGFLLTPYDFWTPGPKVVEQKEFEREVLKLIYDEKYYEAERKLIKDMVHHYKDGESSARVWKFIERILNGE